MTGDLLDLGSRLSGTGDLLDLGSRLSGIGDLHNEGCRLSGIIIQCTKSSSGFQMLLNSDFKYIYFDTLETKLFVFCLLLQNIISSFFSFILCATTIETIDCAKF